MLDYIKKIISNNDMNDEQHKWNYLTINNSNVDIKYDMMSSIIELKTKPQTKYEIQIRAAKNINDYGSFSKIMSFTSPDLGIISSELFEIILSHGDCVKMHNVLFGMVQKMSAAAIFALISKWKAQFCSSSENDKNNIIVGNDKMPRSVLFDAIAICIVHLQKHYAIDDIVCASVMNTLIMIILNKKIVTATDIIQSQLACDYLSKTIISWFRYVDDIEYLLKTLLDVTNCNHTLLKTSALSALMQCAVAVPQTFIKTMVNEALTSADKFRERADKNVIGMNNFKRHEQALICIRTVVQNNPMCFLKHIPLLVSMTACCLNPAHQRIRKNLLSTATATLITLAGKYPNIAIHNQTQLLAIGTGAPRDNCIVIYDLKTTKRRTICKGHRAAVTAVEFIHNGSHVVSYSAYERPPTIKCWSMAFSGRLINTLLSLKGSNNNSKCIKTCPMPPLPMLYTPLDHLQYTKFTWNSKVKGAVKLQRENQSILFFTVLPR
eukprot:429562_1